MREQGTKREDVTDRLGKYLRLLRDITIEDLNAALCTAKLRRLSKVANGM